MADKKVIRTIGVGKRHQKRISGTFKRGNYRSVSQRRIRYN